MVVEATSVTATCGVLPVLADAAVTHLNVATKLPGLSKRGSLHKKKHVFKKSIEFVVDVFSVYHLCWTKEDFLFLCLKFLIKFYNFCLVKIPFFTYYKIFVLCFHICEKCPVNYFLFKNIPVCIIHYVCLQKIKKQIKTKIVLLFLFFFH